VSCALGEGRDGDDDGTVSSGEEISGEGGGGDGADG
jgi:hypothetical protein